MGRPTPLFQWLSSWWRVGGGATVSGSRVSFVAANGRTAVNENQAAPIGSGRFSLEIVYQADTDVTVSMFATRFRGENGTNKETDLSPQTFTLPACKTANTFVRDVYFSPGAVARSWRPVLSFNAPIVIDGLNFYHRIEDTDTPEGELQDGRVRSFDAFGVSGQPRTHRLSARSEVGDTAVMFVSSGWASCPHRPPEGWDYRVTLAAGASGRSGYVATRTVTAPDQTQAVNPWGPGETNPGTARDQAVLMVLKGSGLEPRFVEWGDRVPDFTVPAGGAAVVASQMHAIASVPDEFWDAGGSYQVVAGGRSTAASWSSLHVQRVTEKPRLTGAATHPAAWAALVLAPPQPGPRITIWDGVKEHPAMVNPMPRGCRTVAELLATPGFVIAHRGGSASWPEMSMTAYTNSVARGVHALEVSAQKTTDGVWACVHDRNLQRVHPGAPATPVTEMSWDELSRYKTFGQPILRLQEVIDAYASSHVLVADPKYSAAQHAEFVSFFKKDSTIMKFSADATWLADAFKGHGFTTWGYAYSTNLASGELRKWAPHWDLLGMEMTEGDEPFRETLQIAGSKKVIAHIIPTKAWYDVMVGRGASGVMVSGISDVLREVWV